MKRTRLLLTADAVGGVWRYAIDLARELQPLGIDTVLATLGPPAGAEARDEAAAIDGLELVETGYELDWMAPDAATVSAAAAAMAGLAAERRIDIVHLNSAALAGAVRFGQPLVVGGHGCLATWWRETRGLAVPRALGWHARLAGAGFARADRVVAPSASYAATLAYVYRLSAPAVVVPNGSAPRTAGTGEPVAAAFTAGRLWDEAKNIETLDRAAGLMRHTIRAAGAVRGPHGERAEPRSLQLLGSLSADAMAAALDERPVFVSAARFEPFGLAVLEAAGAGCPLVLSDIATFRELWDEAALFVPADDAEGFAETLDALIADPVRRRALGDAALRRARRYTPARTAAAMAALYADLLPARDGGAGRVAA